MSYYNSAALSGGNSIQDAFDALSGGWAVSQELLTLPFDRQMEGWRSTVMAIPEIQELKQDILEKYDILNPEVLDYAFTLAYIMDTGMMEGSQRFVDIAHRLISGMGEAAPAMKKVVSYVRRRVHAGTTTPAKISRGARLARLQQVQDTRDANRAALKAGPWFGSDPYLPGSRRRQGTYKYTYPGLTKAYRATLATAPRLMAYRMRRNYTRPPSLVKFTVNNPAKALPPLPTPPGDGSMA